MHIVDSKNVETFCALEASFPGGDWHQEFRATHAPDVLVNLSGSRPERGVEAHIGATQQFVEAFPDLRIHLPHRVLFASDGWTCSIATMTGTMLGTLIGPDGSPVDPTGKSFEVELCTAARWEDGVIVEENLLFDTGKFLTDIGII